MNLIKLHQEAMALYDRNEFQAAATLLENCGDNVDLLVLRGICLANTEDFTGARTVLARAAELAPQSPLVFFNRGVVHEQCSDWKTAAADYRRVLQLMPGHAGAGNNLSNILKAHSLLDEAEQVCRDGLIHSPGNTELQMSLAGILSIKGDVPAAVEIYRQALATSPLAFTVRSNLLLNLNYLPLPPEELFREHRLWNRSFQEKYHEAAPVFPPRCGKKIKVGYLSPDFRFHSVAYFIEALLRHHDCERFEIHAFSDVAKADEVTGRIAGSVAHWHDISRMNGDVATAYIREQHMDILVDLAGHTGRKLGVFARRAAPVQVAYLGYPNTTGLRNMDYRFTDELADPTGSERFYSEKLLYLPGGMWAYAPLDSAPELIAPPCRTNGFLTFGSFNNISKISAQTVEIWSQAMLACPGSRLLLKNRAFGEAGVRLAMQQRFAAHGIAAERLELCGFEPDPVGHLRVYNQVDIALDTLPYNGTTTTFESLWMGVPVLTLDGVSHASRVGKAIMARLGLNAFVAADPAEFIRIAAAHAANHDGLAQLRQVARHILADSTLLDGARLAREIEAHYEKISGW